MQEAGGLVDHAQVVREQHRRTFTLRSIRSWSHDAADRPGPERPAPLGVVLLQVLRRLVADRDEPQVLAAAGRGAASRIASHAPIDHWSPR